MFDQYVKLFHLEWIAPWMAEALITIFGALLLGIVMCKVANFINGDSK